MMTVSNIRPPRINIDDSFEEEAVEMPSGTKIDDSFELEAMKDQR